MIKKILIGLILVLATGFFLSRYKIGQGQEMATADVMGEIVVGQDGETNTVVDQETIVKIRKPKKEKLRVTVVDMDNNEVNVNLDEQDLGNEVDINFSEETDLKPGRYKIRFADNSGRIKEKDFWWGVLAINTNQSIYKTNDMAQLAMAVLDEKGNMVCDAQLKLTITSPSGETVTKTGENGVKVNPECWIKDITDRPDYEADYLIGDETGVYKVDLEARTNNGFYKISDKFKVEAAPEFEVERIVNTRLYPFKINTSKIVVKFNRDFKGKIVESVPLGFKIVDSAQMIEEADKFKAIEWEVEAKKDEQINLSYKYDAPDLSPNSFKLGKLKMSENNNQVFEEFRRWQMAVDAEVIIASNLKDATVEYNPAPSTVFTDANTGYMFYLYKINVGNTWGQPVYRKTIDGGATWGSPVGIGNSSPNASFANIAVWYDQWTPGDTTGRRIHMAAIEVTTDDLWYNYIDTANSDAQRSGGWVAAINDGTQYDPGADGNVGITKNTNGDIFVTAAGTFGGTTRERVHRSNDGGSTFINTNFAFDGSVALDDGDYGQLLPLANGDVLYIVQDITARNLVSKELDVGTSAWKNELIIDNDFVENGTYDVSWSATVNKNSGDVYLVANNKIAQTEASLRFYQFGSSSRMWTERQKLVNNSPYLLQGTVMVDPGTNDIYVAYLSGEVSANMNVYYKKSVNGGISWSPQSVELNTLTDDFKYIRSNGWSADLMYVTWYNDDTEDITGIEIPKNVARSPVPDSSVIDLAITDATDEYSNSPNSVFIDSQIGYVFYVDVPSSVKYSKTVDGGQTWGSPISVGNTGLVWANVSVWYDQWTPGDNNGTKIHIAAQEDTTGSKHTWYNYIDTGNNDAQCPNNWVNVVNTTIWTVDTYPGPSITKATDGALFIMGAGTWGTAKTIVMRSGDTGTSWTDTGYNTLLAAGDFGQLLPMAVGTSGAIIYLKQDVSADRITSEVYRGSWQGAVNLENVTFAENATYDAQWGASLNKNTGNIYFAGVNYVGNATNDLKVYKLIAATGLWETRPDIISNNAQLLQASMSVDTNSGDLYVTYIRGGTINSSTDVYFVQSTDDGLTWSGQTQLNTLTDDLKYVRTNLMSSDRLVAVWYDDDLNDIVMNSMGVTKMRQSGYKWFANSDSLTAGAVMSGDNTSATLAAGVNQFRLRLLLHAGVAVQALAIKDYKLQYAVRSGSCDTDFSGESYSDVLTNSGAVRYYDNPSIGDGVTMAVSRYDPIDGGDTVIVQTYKESNNFTNSIDPIYGNKDGEWDFSLGIVGAPESTAYCFRVTKTDGSVLSGGYSNIAEISTASPPGSGPQLDKLLRHGAWFDVGQKKPYTF